MLISILFADITYGQVGNFSTLRVRDKIVIGSGEDAIEKIYNDSSFMSLSTKVSVPSSWTVYNYINNRYYDKARVDSIVVKIREDIQAGGGGGVLLAQLDSTANRVRDELADTSALVRTLTPDISSKLDKDDSTLYSTVSGLKDTVESQTLQRVLDRSKMNINYGIFSKANGSILLNGTLGEYPSYNLTDSSNGYYNNGYMHPDQIYLSSQNIVGDSSYSLTLNGNGGLWSNEMRGGNSSSTELNSTGFSTLYMDDSTILSQRINYGEILLDKQNTINGSQSYISIGGSGFLSQHYTPSFLVVNEMTDGQITANSYDYNTQNTKYLLIQGVNWLGSEQTAEDSAIFVISKDSITHLNKSQKYGNKVYEVIQKDTSYIRFSSNSTNRKLLFFERPQGGDFNISIPFNSGYIPLSVNGNYADSLGNINVSLGGEFIDDVSATDHTTYSSQKINALISNAGGGDMMTTDTATMLLPYLRKTDTTNRWLPIGTVIPDVSGKVNYSDTANMLNNYFRSADTTGKWLSAGTVIPNVSDMVDKSSTQTIPGAKTFTGAFDANNTTVKLSGIPFTTADTMSFVVQDDVTKRLYKTGLSDVVDNLGVATVSDISDSIRKIVDTINAFKGRVDFPDSIKVAQPLKVAYNEDTGEQTIQIDTVSNSKSGVLLSEYRTGNGDTLANRLYVRTQVSNAIGNIEIGGGGGSSPSHNDSLLMTHDYVIVRDGVNTTALSSRHGSFSGTDAAVIIQRAIDTIYTPENAPGGSIILGPGFYYMNGHEIVIDANGDNNKTLYIEGSGDNTQLYQDASDKNVIVVSNNAALKMKKLFLNAGASSLSAIKGIADSRNADNKGRSIMHGILDDIKIVSLSTKAPAVDLVNPFYSVFRYINIYNTDQTGIAIRNESDQIFYGNSQFDYVYVNAPADDSIPGILVTSDRTDFRMNITQFDNIQVFGVNGQGQNTGVGVKLVNVANIKFNYSDIEFMKIPIWVDNSYRVSFDGGMLYGTNGIKVTNQSYTNSFDLGIGSQGSLQYAVSDSSAFGAGNEYKLRLDWDIDTSDVHWLNDMTAVHISGTGDQIVQNDVYHLRAQNLWSGQNKFPYNKGENGQVMIADGDGGFTWGTVGGGGVDLSNYYTKTQVNDSLNTRQKNIAVYNIMDYGGNNQGGGDNTTPLLNTIAAANGNLVLIPHGNFYFDSTVNIDASSSDINILAYGDLYFEGGEDGFVFTNLDNNGSGGAFYNINFDLKGSLVNTGNSGGDWSSFTNTAITINNTVSSTFNISDITNWEVGIKVMTSGANYVGTAYNKISFDNIEGANYGIQLLNTGEETSFTNQNSFHGGKVAAMKGIVMTPNVSGTSAFSGNIFYNISLEGNKTSAIDWDRAEGNYFLYGRANKGENPLAGSVVNLSSTSKWNIFKGWFMASDVTDLGTDNTFEGMVDAQPFASSKIKIINSTSNKTLALADASGLVTQNSSSATTVTVPASASVGFKVGTQITVARYGDGTVTITPDGGVTIVSADDKTDLRAKGSTATLVKTDTDTWLLTGDID